MVSANPGSVLSVCCDHVSGDPAKHLAREESRMRKWCAVFVLTTLAVWCVWADHVELHFIDVSHGDSIYIRLPNGYDVLIDGGRSPGQVLGHLRAHMQDDLLDLVVATHYHSDHTGGLYAVLEASDFRVLDVLSPGVCTPEGFASAAHYAVSQTGGTWYSLHGTPTARQGTHWEFGEHRLTVLGPGRSHGCSSNTTANNDSIVLLLSGPAVRALFMGDAEQLGELDAVYYAQQKVINLNVDVLKVGHHGSNTSTTWSLLAASRPSVAVISDSGPHVSASTLDRLAAAGADVYATYHHGTVMMRFSQTGLSVHTDRGPEPLALTATVELLPKGTPSLFLDSMSVTTPVRTNQTARLNARSAPGADCRISVYYASGPSGSKSLNLTKADTSGQVSWSWQVGGNTSSGVYYAEVTAELRGKIVSSFIPFEVLRHPAYSAVTIGLLWQRG